MDLGILNLSFSSEKWPGCVAYLCARGFYILHVAHLARKAVIVTKAALEPAAVR